MFKELFYCFLTPEILSLGGGREGATSNRLLLSPDGLAYSLGFGAIGRLNKGWVACGRLVASGGFIREGGWAGGNYVG